MWEINSTCRWSSDFSSSPLYPQLEISEIILKGRNPKEKGKYLPNFTSCRTESRRISHTIRVWLAWICLIVLNPRLVNNYSMAKNKLIYHMRIRKSMERSRFEVYWDLSIPSNLHFERDTLVSFWAFLALGWFFTLFCNPYSKKLVKTYLVFLLNQEICSPPFCLFWQQPKQLLRIQNHRKSPLCQNILW